MIKLIKEIYNLFPQDELEKAIPKVNKIGDIDETTKIVFINDLHESYLILYVKNKEKERIPYKSIIYNRPSEVNVFYKDINNAFSINVNLIKEILEK